jgi:hypothetical protein
MKNKKNHRNKKITVAALLGNVQRKPLNKLLISLNIKYENGILASKAKREKPDVRRPGYLDHDATRRNSCPSPADPFTTLSLGITWRNSGLPVIMWWRGCEGLGTLDSTYNRPFFTARQICNIKIPKRVSACTQTRS